MSAGPLAATARGPRQLVLVHSADEPPAGRVRAAVLARAAEVLPALNVITAGGRRIIYCLECGRQAQPGTDDVCCWWPFGCRTGPDDPLPRVCWACCTPEQRHELVEIGCTEAAIKVALDDNGTAPNSDAPGAR